MWSGALAAPCGRHCCTRRPPAPEQVARRLRLRDWLTHVLLPAQYGGLAISLRPNLHAPNPKWDTNGLWTGVHNGMFVAARTGNPGWQEASMRRDQVNGRA